MIVHITITNACVESRKPPAPRISANAPPNATTATPTRFTRTTIPQTQVCKPKTRRTSHARGATRQRSNRCCSEHHIMHNNATVPANTAVVIGTNAKRITAAANATRRIPDGVLPPGRCSRINGFRKYPKILALASRAFNPLAPQAAVTGKHEDMFPLQCVVGFFFCWPWAPET